jgi:hypothetical protein
MPPKPISARDHEVGKRSDIDAVSETREVLNTADMMMDGFFKGYQGDIDELARLAAVDAPSQVVFASDGQSQGPSRSEKAVITLMDVRDSLVGRYSQVANNEPLSLLFTSCIRKLEQGMTKLGAAVEPFDPKAHSSGLGSGRVEGILDNAKKVVENTKASYNLHKIAKIYPGKASDGRPGIGIEIEGDEAGKPFKVVGKVIAKSDFSGNEAIDYVKDAKKGMMSVKALKLGQWHDISDQFDVYWGLQAPQA